MSFREETRTVSTLLTEAFGQLSTLVRSEINLAQAEVTAKLTSAAVGAGLMAGAAILMIPVLVMVLVALAAALMSAGVPEALADLLSAVIGLIISGSLAWVGLNRLRADTLAPTRTIVQLQKDAAAAKGHLS